MNEAKEALLEALTAERFDNRWWVTRDDQDHELEQARRRRVLAEADESEAS